MFELKLINQDSGINTTLNKALHYILKNQLPNGAVPWFENGKLDPWDHTETLIALCIGNKFDAARQGFRWLSNNQNADGSWFTKYFNETDQTDQTDAVKIETNFVAYPATGLWYYYLTTKDINFIKELYPSIKKSIDYVVNQQTPEGDIQWASSSLEALPKDALITACSSILRSLECAIFLADICDDNSSQWENAYNLLADALKNKPWRFDRTWESKNRFSMDWFYPILSGVYSVKESSLRIMQDWEKFVEPEFGCRCVSDEPWVTIAESCELVIALVSAKKIDEAEKLFLKLLRWQDIDGGFWTGYVYKDSTIWPKEKTTWTAAAIIMAADALYSLSPGATVLTSPSHLHFS